MNDRDEFIYKTYNKTMKLYNVLIQKDRTEKITDIMLIKDGFSWGSFLFNGLWFLYHKMWQEFLLLTVITGFLTNSEKFSDSFDGILLSFALSLIVAFNANYWLCEHLKKKKYQFMGLVFGANIEDARMRFIHNLQADIEVGDSILNPKAYSRQQKEVKKLKKKVLA